MKKCSVCQKTYTGKFFKGGKCAACIKRSWRNKNPEKAAFLALKAGAKQRNIEFSLTFEEFLNLSFLVTYIQRKGVKKDSYHIDRIDAGKGYEVGNIQLLTASENGRKGMTEDRRLKFLRANVEYDTTKRKYSVGFKAVLEPVSDNSNVPF